MDRKNEMMKIEDMDASGQKKVSQSHAFCGRPSRTFGQPKKTWDGSHFDLPVGWTAADPTVALGPLPDGQRFFDY
jgi:hypothetical protein